MLIRKAFLIIGLLYLNFGISSPAQADYEKGLEAANRGDFKTAIREWLIDSNQGNVAAQYNLGIIYSNGRGVPENDAEAVRWFRMAADQGHPDAQINLGLKFANDRGVPKNDAEAVRWYRMAADQGYSEAQFSLGVMYATGEGVPENFVTAYMWFNLAGAQGIKDAQENKQKLRSKMTPEQIAEAQRLAAEWLEKHK